MKKIIILLKQALQPMLINNAGNIDFMLFATTLDFLMLVTYVCLNQSRLSIRSDSLSIYIIHR